MEYHRALKNNMLCLARIRNRDNHNARMCKEKEINDEVNNLLIIGSICKKLEYAIDALYKLKTTRKTDADVDVIAAENRVAALQENLRVAERRYDTF